MAVMFKVIAVIFYVLAALFLNAVLQSFFPGVLPYPEFLPFLFLTILVGLPLLLIPLPIAPVGVVILFFFVGRALWKEKFWAKNFILILSLVDMVILLPYAFPEPPLNVIIEILFNIFIIAAYLVWFFLELRNNAPFRQKMEILAGRRKIRMVKK